MEEDCSGIGACIVDNAVVLVEGVLASYNRFEEGGVTSVLLFIALNMMV